MDKSWQDVVVHWWKLLEHRFQHQLAVANSRNLFEGLPEQLIGLFLIVLGIVIFRRGSSPPGLRNDYGANFTVKGILTREVFGISFTPHVWMIQLGVVLVGLGILVVILRPSFSDLVNIWNLLVDNNRAKSF